MTAFEANSIDSFGQWVRKRRDALGFTRPGLATRVGCSPVTIKKIERDERQPSRQIAELLADHLVIPDADRDLVIRVARGEFVTSTISSRGLVSLPAFLREPDQSELRKDTPFVAREDELDQLGRYLDAACLGKGRIIFITGEAGEGKTLLAQEFARRAQVREPELIIGTGNCSAHTGSGDPYLPFREILALLTGDIESRWAAGTISTGNARRLWQMVPHTIQALLDVGPDLVDIFIPGPALVMRAEAAAPSATGLLTRLRALVTRHQSRQSQAHLRQGSLFSQYTTVLQTLAKQNPLLLIIDDLQWADEGSANLLFHLGRRLEGHRILVVGLYRPSDIRLGRNGERHPLDPVINELQRQFGKIHVSLTQAGGKEFVEDYLDAIPNQLGPAFGEALYRQTGGHPLFTVEMLRGLQERQELVQDEEGRWVKDALIDWRELPARIEGAIQERISRLPDTARQIAKIASVEGEVFTGQVVARVHGLDERQLASLLGKVLERQHCLVKVWDSQQTATKRLTRYRFRHILFQQYLYDNLTQAERAYFHGEIGSALEQLYGKQVDLIAPQLARHFAIAGEDRRAFNYFVVAGDLAAAAHAHVEAVAHYGQAVEIAQQHEVKEGKLIDVYTKLGRSLELNSEFDRALTIYERMEKVGLQREDSHLELAALMAQVTVYATFTPAYDPDCAEVLANQALVLARALDDQAAEARIMWAMLFVYLTTNRLKQAIESGQRSLALARKLNLREQMAYTLTDLGSHCYLVNGSLDQATAVLDEAHHLWRELDNLPMLANSLSASSLVHVYAGNYRQALDFSDEAFQLSRSIDNLWGQSYSRFRTGWICWERGEPDRAISMMETAIRLAEQSSFMAPQASTRADLAYVYGRLGAVDRGVETAAVALTVAETKAPPFRLIVLAIVAQLYLWQDNLAEAKAVIARGKKDPCVVGWPLHNLAIRVADAKLALRQHNYARALSVTDELLEDLRQMEVREYIPKTLYLQGCALLSLDEKNAARGRLLEARAGATSLGSRPSLWPILVALSQLTDNPVEAQALRQQAREIVEYIAKHSPAALRRSFLSLPAVRAVLDE